MRAIPYTKPGFVMTARRTPGVYTPEPAERTCAPSAVKSLYAPEIEDLRERWGERRISPQRGVDIVDVGVAAVAPDLGDDQSVLRHESIVGRHAAIIPALRGRGKGIAAAWRDAPSRAIVRRLTVRSSRPHMPTTNPTLQRPSPGISRIDQPSHRTHGFAVRFGYPQTVSAYRPTVSKYFPNKTHGGKAKAWQRRRSS